MRIELNMDTQVAEECCGQVEKQSVKLEEAGARIEGMLLPLFPEVDDSGIDSDSTELLASSARQLAERQNELSDSTVSSSDEDPLADAWWHVGDKGKEGQIAKAISEGRIKPLDMNWPMGYHQQDYHQPDYLQPDYRQPDYRQPDYRQPDYHQPDYRQPDYRQPDYRQPEYCQKDYRRTFEELSLEQDRSSPPLFEIELTASDEDDDASVLELVIPMQSPRYKRVPTASPKKTKPKQKTKPAARTSYYNFICCMRK